MPSSQAFIVIGVAFVVVQLVCSVPLPVKKANTSHDKVDTRTDEERKQEYKRYIDELVEELGADPEIKKQLETMTKDDLENLIQEIRSPDDEEFREELEEQRRLQRHKMARENDIRERPDGYDANDTPESDEEFERLMQEHRDRLTKIDQRQHERFVKQQMHKEHERRKHLKGLSEKERLEAEEKHEAERAKLKNHPRLHHPGSQQQLQEVWEKEDGMDPDNFNPETFFHLHDTNEDGHLDYGELEALLANEVEKVHDDPNSPEFAEEMTRMRQHIVSEVDKDKDGMISLQEFMASTQLKQFSQDDEWKDIDDEDQYTDEDFEEYEKLMEEQERQEKNLLQDDRDAEHQPVQHPGQQALPIHHQEQVPVHHEQPQAPQHQQPPHHEQPPASQHHQQMPQHHEQPQVQHHEQPQAPQHHEQPQAQQHHEQPQAQQHHEQPQAPQHHEQPQAQQHHEQPQAPQHHEQPQAQHDEQPQAPQHHEQPQAQHHEQPQAQHHEQPQAQHHEQPQAQHHEQPQAQHHEQPQAQQHHEQQQPQQPHVV